MERNLENDYVKIWIKDEILYCLYKNNKILDIKCAKQIVKDRIDLQNGKTYKALVYPPKPKFTTKQGRNYLSEEGSKGISAVSIILNQNIFVRSLVNWFLNYENPDVPYKAHNSEEEALEWLKSLD